MFTALRQLDEEISQSTARSIRESQSKKHLEDLLLQLEMVKQVAAQASTQLYSTQSVLAHVVASLADDAQHLEGQLAGECERWAVSERESRLRQERCDELQEALGAAMSRCSQLVCEVDAVEQELGLSCGEADRRIDAILRLGVDAAALRACLVEAEEREGSALLSLQTLTQERNASAALALQVSGFVDDWMVHNSEGIEQEVPPCSSEWDALEAECGNSSLLQLGGVSQLAAKFEASAKAAMEEVSTSRNRDQVSEASELAAERMTAEAARANAERDQAMAHMRELQEIREKERDRLLEAEAQLSAALAELMSSDLALCEAAKEGLLQLRAKEEAMAQAEAALAAQEAAGEAARTVEARLEASHSAALTQAFTELAAASCDRDRAVEAIAEVEAEAERAGETLRAALEVAEGEAAVARSAAVEALGLQAVAEAAETRRCEEESALRADLLRVEAEKEAAEAAFCGREEEVKGLRDALAEAHASVEEARAGAQRSEEARWLSEARAEAAVAQRAVAEEEAAQAMEEKQAAEGTAAHAARDACVQAEAEARLAVACCKAAEQQSLRDRASLVEAQREKEEALCAFRLSSSRLEAVEAQALEAFTERQIALSELSHADVNVANVMRIKHADAAQQQQQLEAELASAVERVVAAQELSAAYEEKEKVMMSELSSSAASRYDAEARCAAAAEEKREAIAAAEEARLDAMRAREEVAVCLASTAEDLQEAERQVAMAVEEAQRAALAASTAATAQAKAEQSHQALTCSLVVAEAESAVVRAVFTEALAAAETEIAALATERDISLVAVKEIFDAKAIALSIGEAAEETRSSTASNVSQASAERDAAVARAEAAIRARDAAEARAVFALATQKAAEAKVAQVLQSSEAEVSRATSSLEAARAEFQMSLTQMQAQHRAEIGSFVSRVEGATRARDAAVEEARVANSARDKALLEAMQFREDAACAQTAASFSIVAHEAAEVIAMEVKGAVEAARAEPPSKAELEADTDAKLVERGAIEIGLVRTEAHQMESRLREVESRLRESQKRAEQTGLDCVHWQGVVRQLTLERHQAVSHAQAAVEAAGAAEKRWLAIEGERKSDGARNSASVKNALHCAREEHRREVSQILREAQFEQLRLQRDCEAMLGEAQRALQAKEKQVEALTRPPGKVVEVEELQKALETVAQAREEAAEQRALAAQAKTVAERTAAQLSHAQESLVTERWQRFAWKRKANVGIPDRVHSLGMKYSTQYSSSKKGPRSDILSLRGASDAWVPVLDVQSKLPLNVVDGAVFARVLSSQVVPTCRSSFDFCSPERE